MHEAEADAEASSESEEEDELEATSVQGVMPAKDLARMADSWDFQFVGIPAGTMHNGRTSQK
jgi:hypothetical protein